MIGFNDYDFRKVPPVPKKNCPGSIRGAFHRGISTTRSLSGNFSLVKSQENMAGKTMQLWLGDVPAKKGVMTPEILFFVFLSDLASIVCFLDGINTILDG